MFTQRLKELRARGKISQKNLAKILGVAAGTVGMWETGERNPDREMLIKIADYFTVSLDYLVGRNNPDNILDHLTSEDRAKAEDYIKLLLNQKNNPDNRQGGSYSLPNTGKENNEIQIEIEKRKRA